MEKEQLQTEETIKFTALKYEQQSNWSLVSA